MESLNRPGSELVAAEGKLKLKMKDRGQSDREDYSLTPTEDKHEHLLISGTSPSYLILTCDDSVLTLQVSAHLYLMLTRRWRL